MVVCVCLSVFTPVTACLVSPKATLLPGALALVPHTEPERPPAFSVHSRDVPSRCTGARLLSQWAMCLLDTFRLNGEVGTVNSNFSLSVKCTTALYHATVRLQGKLREGHCTHKQKQGNIRVSAVSVKMKPLIGISSQDATDIGEYSSLLDAPRIARGPCEFLSRTRKLPINCKYCKL